MRQLSQHGPGDALMEGHVETGSLWLRDMAAATARR